jgi:hypothetical protein
VPANRALTGDGLAEALKAKNWDPSIRALIAFPQVVSLMADKIEWTEQLGNTFLTQQAEVMAEVQKLRDEARIAGNPKATAPVTAVRRAAPKRAKYYAYWPRYRYVYKYAPYRYAYNYTPYAYYGPAPYHADGY